ncbi:hypothetical protein SLH49_09400 [Cognatiyoonia sp. IB215446]|uniref:hypothetical protein n=1 Tax=Cognatiyoonia sp. IB215446 TaxID=3097355 RepID=UPI002A13898B|nr:hypothetical protein [Cognatiyoonia sp. IB215446]MDX8348202.1 hypothetical protein [Cognatiyoonia sp. IB215446]
MPFKITKSLSAIAVGLSLSACLPAETGSQNGASVNATTGVAASDPVVAASFDGGSVRWNDDSVMVYRFMAIERAGEVFLCGAYAGEGRSYTTQFNRELLRRSAATVNGEEVMRNLAFFNRASAETLEAGLEGSNTRCRSTGLAAGSVALEDVDVELRQGRIRIRV